jgi:hypothetical protein
MRAKGGLIDPMALPSVDFPDDLLDHLLDDGSTMKRGKRAKKTPTDDTSDSSASPFNEDRYVGQIIMKPAGCNMDESSMSSYERSDDEGTAKLLMRANQRIQDQFYRDEIKSLQDIIRHKDEELAVLTCQLRRATTTKCDLVVACTDIERQHEFDLKAREANVKIIKKENLSLMETRAEVEKEFMNEIADLTRRLADMDRKQRNQMLEKDFEIAKLQERIRRFKAESVRPKKDQNKSF